MFCYLFFVISLSKYYLSQNRCANPIFPTNEQTHSIDGNNLATTDEQKQLKKESSFSFLPKPGRKEISLL